jgi:hypothetical protein
MLWSLPFLAGTIVLNHASAKQVSTTVGNADVETPGGWADKPWSGGLPVAGGLAGFLSWGSVRTQC